MIFIQSTAPASLSAQAGGNVLGEQQEVSEKTLFQNRDYPVLNEYRAVLGGLFGRMYGLSSQQLRFLSLLKNHVRDYCTIEMRQLFEQPFTHIHNEGVTGVFPDLEQIVQLQKIVEELGVVTDAATV